MITVTWDDGQGTPTTYTVSSDVLLSLDQFRQTLTQADRASQTMVLRYPTVKDMIVGTFIEQIVLPAVTHFPPASVVQAQANVAAAQAALAAAQAVAVGIGG